MKNKGLIYFLTIIISFLSIYYLQFTFVSQRIQGEATEKSRDLDGNIDFQKKQKYLDSIWNKPVYNLLTDFTYKEVKESELNLGLDLQGGMHVTLEVSPVDILIGLSSESKDPDFLLAINNAREVVRGTQTNFISQFYSEFKSIAPDKDLSIIFATVSNRGRIGFDTSDSEILDIINEEVESAIDRSFNILRTRIDRFGTSQPNIQRLQGTGRIQIELPGVDNPERVRKLLQGVAKLEFWEVAEVSENEVFQTLQVIDQFAASQNIIGGANINDNPQDSQSEDSDLEELFSEDSDVSELNENQNPDSLSQEPSNNSSPLLGNLRTDFGGLFYNIEDTLQINTIIKNENIRQLIPNNIKFLWSVKPLTSITDANGQVTDIDGEVIELFVIRTSRGGKAPLTGEVITDARQDLDQSARPSISMQMNSNGAKNWRRLTSTNIGRRVAIVLDNYVYSFPTVQSEISGGRSQISGNFSINEANDLSNILKSGKLPAPARIIEEAIVGPSLGKEAIDSGLKSFIIALSFVLLYMMFYYSFAGLVSNLALLANLFFVFGVLSSLGAVLTLPGIAGIVLTIGMSVDANVLIYERIREELSNGKGLKLAVSDGYKNAYSSIIDANVTTLLTGIILYIFGSGPIKGFATTLVIGILTSLFSAIFITRLIFHWKLEKKGTDTFDNSITKGAFKNTAIDFIGKRKFFYGVSSLIILIGIGSLITKKLNYGVDFKGGRTFVVRFDQPVDNEAVRNSLADYFVGDSGLKMFPEVKTFGDNNQVKITTKFLIDSKELSADSVVAKKLDNGLSEIGNYEIMSSQKVGPTIADDIKVSALWSIIFSLLVIFLYILLRFRKWQFSLGAVAAVFHDVLIVLSIFSLFYGILPFSLEIDQAFIAALLTIIGYSLNDTVVVFDRIREHMNIYKKKEFTSLVNNALNSTLSRTVNTSLTTFFVLLVIFLFGGEVIRGFMFALMVGVIVGTYSSLFVASPIMVDTIKKSENKK